MAHPPMELFEGVGVRFECMDYSAGCRHRRRDVSEVRARIDDDVAGLQSLDSPFEQIGSIPGRFAKPSVVEVVLQKALMRHIVAPCVIDLPGWLG